MLPHSGVDARGTSAPPKVSFVKNIGKISKHLGINIRHILRNY